MVSIAQLLRVNLAEYQGKEGSRKRPDGYTCESFRSGQPLAWDFTCSDTLAPSHCTKSSKIAGSAAEWAENKKFAIYGNSLGNDYHFVLIAVETPGNWGLVGHKFIKDIGKKILEITKDPKSTSYIFQTMIIAIQKGNVQCVQNTYGESTFEELDELYYTVQSNNS